MKGSTNYIHIILTLSIALIMVTLISGLAYGVIWYFNTYMGNNLDPSNNVITSCIGKCQEEQICSAGTSSNYRLVNGECQCSCIKIKNTLNTNASENTNTQNTGWLLYEHPNFTVQYPSDWEVRTDISGSDLASETVAFSSPETEGDNIWSVLLYNTDSTGMDELIAGMGDQFPDRKETRERITVAGKQATRVTVTTDTIAGWKHVQIFFEDGDTLYAINDGASRNTEFETFYNSFQLIE
ncbi:MAG: hypothetical protein WCT33_00895 [Patescibacteria group bacterium]